MLCPPGTLATLVTHFLVWGLTSIGSPPAARGENCPSPNLWFPPDGPLTHRASNCPSGPPCTPVPPAGAVPGLNESLTAVGGRTKDTGQESQEGEEAAKGPRSLPRRHACSWGHPDGLSPLSSPMPAEYGVLRERDPRGMGRLSVLLVLPTAERLRRAGRSAGFTPAGSPGPTGRSPVAVEALQLALHGAADAAAVAPVQPVAHHAQPVVPLLAVEGEVLHPGGDALSAPGPVQRASAVLFFPGGWGDGSQPAAPTPHILEGGLGEDWVSGEPSQAVPSPCALEEGCPTHRGVCTPSGETGEAERGMPRK